MLKQAGAALAVAAAFLAVGSPAMADPGYHWNNEPLLVVGNANNVNVTAGVCGNNVGVLGAAVPINSPSITETCAASYIEDGDDFGHWGHDD
ncbi:hypothetical protein SAMN05216188_102267 [Lentzea xinjiangensis]|uniref:Small secreted domain n=1 Tax=Lentzea xinjiangensis TaxID=402600 RepID=A0A1H9DST3_9PSEU|nr:hypothetical protein [Lentzea xinjiangensis]SEQ16511.1 hypothetical protein SAMN05216188_102267 [Lentzea xinjiangensis]